MVRAVLNEEDCFARHICVIPVEARFDNGAIIPINEAKTIIPDELLDIPYIVVRKCVVYEYNGGMCSGSVGTATYNSVNNQINAKYIQCAIIIHPDVFVSDDLPSVERVNRNTTVTYGDDIIISVTQDNPEITQESFMAMSYVIGMEYTPETKDAVTCAFKPITEVTLLKRGFWVHDLDGKWSAPLNIDVILEMPQWTKKGAPGEALPNTVDTSLKELGGHPRAMWDLHARGIITASIEELSYTPKYLTYEEAFRAFRSSLEYY